MHGLYEIIRLKVVRPAHARCDSHVLVCELGASPFCSRRIIVFWKEAVLSAFLLMREHRWFALACCAQLFQLLADDLSRVSESSLFLPDGQGRSPLDIARQGTDEGHTRIVRYLEGKASTAEQRSQTAPFPHDTGEPGWAEDEDYEYESDGEPAVPPPAPERAAPDPAAAAASSRDGTDALGDIQWSCTCVLLHPLYIL